jgi:alanyl-tRNA synthetase
MTERLYYTDCYARDFQARVVARDGAKLYLDKTAFYPSSGGQPFDTGLLGGARVADVIDEGDRVAHLLEGSVEGEIVTGAIDWSRRYDHMQQHTGQHLLSAVLADLFGIETVSFHMGREVSTIEVAAAALAPDRILRAEERANEIVWEQRPVTIAFRDSSEDLGLRKQSERSGTVRVVSIADLDNSACGGTHVRTTAECGPILLRKLEKLRGNVRIEFVCGGRAVRRARTDYDALTRIARAFSSPLDDAPALVESQLEKARELEKSARRIAIELAGFHGRALYEATVPGVDGVRRVTEKGPIGDDVRTKAQAFVAGSKAVFLAVSEEPAAVLLAASADSGINAGAALKAALAQVGGRGGGSATLAQGSVPSKEALAALVEKLAAG